MSSFRVAGHTSAQPDKTVSRTDTLWSMLRRLRVFRGGLIVVGRLPRPDMLAGNMPTGRLGDARQCGIDLRRARIGVIVVRGRERLRARSIILLHRRLGCEIGRANV